MKFRWPRHLDLAAAALFSSTLLLAVAVFPSEVSPWRVVLGFVVILLVPGYALTSVLFPGTGDVDDVERLVLSIGLSVVTVPLLGLALNYTPWGLGAVPMTLGLWLVTMSAVIAALHRRRSLAAGASTRPVGAGAAWPILRLVVLVGGVMTAVVLIVQELRPPVHATEFYLLGPDGGLEGFPTVLANGETFTVFIGITNHEGARESYRISVPFADLMLEVPPLEDGATWEERLELVAPEGSGRTSLSLELYRLDDMEPYRSVHIIVMLQGAGDLERPLTRSAGTRVRWA